MRHFRFEILVFVAQMRLGLLEFEVGADAGANNGWAQWFGDVVDGTVIEATFFILGGVHGGDEDHRNLCRARIELQLGDDFVAVHFRHHHIKQDQVGSQLAAGDLQRAATGVGCAHPPGRLQHFAENGEVLGRVIHNQDGGEQCVRW